MTVKELIALLQTCDQNTDVVVNGYEGGVSDVRQLNSFEVFVNANTEWYYGSHEEVYEGDETEGKATKHVICIR